MESILFRIMKLKELYLLQDEIEGMDDPEEREIRSGLIDGILEKITDYDVHVREYTYRKSVQKLMDRGIICTEINRESLVDQWDQCFESLVSGEAKAAAVHYSDQFRWHLFSFGLLNAVQGAEAMAWLDALDKKSLFLFFDYSDRAYRLENAYLLKAGDLDMLRENSPLELSDMYLFDPAGKWTYVRPHEVCCGPYFFRAD